MASIELLPDSKIPYGVDGSETHLVAGDGLGDHRGSEEGVFATVGCHYFPLGPQLASQPKSVTIL